MINPRLGLVARSDNGGLSAQSLEFSKALNVNATLVVNLSEKGRGPNHNYDWHNPFYVDGPNINDLPTVQTFLDHCDVVLSIETFYGAQVISLATERGIPTVRYANPELYRNEEESHVVLPTEWERERVYQASVIPQGITVQPNASEFVRDRPARNLLHMGAPAMMDRNGTGDFYAALAHTKHNFNVTIVGPDTKQYYKSGNHQYMTYSEFKRDRFDWYKEHIDLMVLPRRYGGLCLPMLEAASFGIPTLTTDLSPQDKWFSHDCLIPTTTWDNVNMVGGRFRVYNTDIESLTYRLDRYANESVGLISRQALAWAEKNSWKNIAPMWNEYFQKICT